MTPPKDGGAHVADSKCCIAQGPGKVSGMGETESATGPPPSQQGLRAKLLQGATWALALTGWSYILTPRMTLSAYFGASGTFGAAHTSSRVLVPAEHALRSRAFAGLASYNRVSDIARLDSIATQRLPAVVSAVLLTAPECS